MGKNILLLIVLIIATLLFNCGNTNTYHAEIQSNSDQLKRDQNGLIQIPSDITTTTTSFKHTPIQNIAKISYIKLESGNNQLVSTRYAMGVTREHIFMRQGESILRFGIDGKFKNKIGHQGNGPQEYTAIRNVAFNDPMQEIYISDSKLRFVFIYDYNNNFKKKIPYRWQNGAIDAMKVVDDSTLLISRSSELMHLYDYGQFQLLSLNSGSFKNLTKKYEIPKGSIGRLLMDRDFLSNAEDGYLMYDFSSDTVYCFNTKNKSIYPKYILNPTTKDKGTKQECYIQTVYESSKFIRIYYWRENLSGGFFYLDKETGQIDELAFTDANITTKDEKIQMGLIESDIRNIYHNSLDAFKLCDLYKNNDLTGELKEIAKTLKEDDNPVIVLATLKD